MRLLSSLVLLTLAAAAHAQPEDDSTVQLLRVMGGTAIAPGEFPSTVALHRKGHFAGTPAGHHCGATVVAPRWVLTAAHCVTGLRGAVVAPQSAAAFVVAEPRDLGTRLAAGAVRLIQVDTIVVHPGYAIRARQMNGGTDVIAAPNDVALLHLQEDSGRPSQLLAGGGDRDVLERPQRAATIVGFGQTLESAPPSADLLGGPVPIAPIERCRERHRPASAGLEDLIGPTQLCAGFKGGKVDACHGDSGGPLFVRGTAGVVQVGIVSLGPSCVGEALGYGTYASVAALSGWIASHVRDAGFTRGERPPQDPPPPAAPPPPGPAAAVPQRPAAGDPSGLEAQFGTPPLVDPARTAQVSIDIREGTSLRVGGRATFRVVSSLPGMLVVLVRDPAGQWTQLFPNSFLAAFHPEQRAQAGQAPLAVLPGRPTLFPGPADRFAATVRPPAGEGTLYAVVVPPTKELAELVLSHVGLEPIADPEGYLQRLAGAVQSVRSMAPEPLKRSLAMGERRFTVLP